MGEHYRWFGGGVLSIVMLCILKKDEGGRDVYAMNYYNGYIEEL